tara:strand:- start:141 stop:419 length:279 start_codon:yes stop_codon:yes gene_type:complete
VLHKISDLCKKIDGIKILSDTLSRAKYGNPKADVSTINHLVDQIQADCLNIAMDKSKYWKPNSKPNMMDVMSEEEEREWKLLDKKLNNNEKS